MKQAILSVIATVWFIHVSYRAYHWVGFSVAIVLIAIPFVVSIARYIAQKRANRLRNEAILAMRRIIADRTESRIVQWQTDQEGNQSDDGIDTKLQEFVSSRFRSKRRRMGHRLQDGQTPPDKPVIQ